MKFKKFVKAGAKLLDEKGPKEWWNNVKLKKLDMPDPTACVLTQVYGNYIEGLRQLNILFTPGDEDPFTYGFTLCFDISTNKNWTKLTKKWKKQIRKRQENL
jgi:hypothetical protein